MTDDVNARLAQLRASHAALTAWVELASLTDDAAHAASRLPGWTRGHVLTHLARNADGIVRTLNGALRGEIVERYPGGDEAKQAAIAAGARRSADELRADVRDSTERLDQSLAAVAAADGWQLPTADGHFASRWLARRWREVEIHRVDLDAGYSPDQWSPEFVDYLLGSVTRTLDSRSGELGPVLIESGRVVLNAGEPGETTVLAPPWAVAAWLVGREASAEPMRGVPGLLPWI